MKLSSSEDTTATDFIKSLSKISQIALKVNQIIEYAARDHSEIAWFNFRDFSPLLKVRQNCKSRSMFSHTINS